MDIRRLILILAVVSTLVTLINGFFATYLVQRQLLIANTLEANRIYAEKLALSADLFFETSLGQLKYSAALLATGFDDPHLLQTESQRLLLQTASFNSVVVVDSTGVVLATSPDTIRLKETKLTTPGALQALKMRGVHVSQPYFAATANLVIFISAPIITEQGRFLGYVGGTIYLKQHSILDELFREDFYNKDSFTFVIDDEGKNIYRQDTSHISEKMAQGALNQVLRRQKSGSVQVDNGSGVNELAGYASVPIPKWTIFTVRTTDNTLLSLRPLMLDVLHQTLPLIMLTLTGVWFFAHLISQPLRQLALSATEMDRADTFDDIKHISAWYHEVAQLKRAMLLGMSLLQNKIGRLNAEVQTDPMTGLLNRRGLAKALDRCVIDSKPLSILALDIDLFKNVNDTYGHDAGDTVINLLALQLRRCCRATDILCRNGGEEFLVLLPSTGRELGIIMAERLRECVANMYFPKVGHITVSIGVASWTPASGMLGLAIKQADEALYRAKKEGRNRVVVACDKVGCYPGE